MSATFACVASGLQHLIMPLYIGPLIFNSPCNNHPHSYTTYYYYYDDRYGVTFTQVRALEENLTIYFKDETGIVCCFQDDDGVGQPFLIHMHHF